MNPKARQRAELIFQVRSGQMTASQAAKTLGISRQAYYQWERRALQALMRAVEDQPSGRPKSPIDPEKQKALDEARKNGSTVDGTNQIIEDRFWRTYTR